MASWLIGDFRFRRWLPLFADTRTEQQYLSDRFSSDHISVSRAFIVFSLYYAIFAIADIQVSFISESQRTFALCQKMFMPIFGLCCFLYVNQKVRSISLTFAVYVYSIVYAINLFITFYGYTHWLVVPATTLEITLVSAFINILIFIYAPLKLQQQMFGAFCVLVATLTFLVSHTDLHSGRGLFSLMFLFVSNSFGVSVALTIHKNFRKYWANKQEREMDNKKLRGEIRRREKLELELKKLAMTDPLTNINNRRSFMEHLNREIKRVERQHNELSVINFDIDLFKHINDQFGHDVGDRVLVDVAALVEERLRESDMFGRLGGEEFAVLLPDTNNIEALSVAEELRHALCDHAIVYQDKVLKITASFGVAQYQQDEAVGKLLKRADEAMYAAKKAGRNCVKGQLS